LPEQAAGSHPDHIRTVSPYGHAIQPYYAARLVEAAGMGVGVQAGEDELVLKAA